MGYEKFVRNKGIEIVRVVNNVESWLKYWIEFGDIKTVWDSWGNIERLSEEKIGKEIYVTFLREYFEYLGILRFSKDRNIENLYPEK